MDIFRSKKRDTESASLGDVPANLQKKQRSRAGSVDSLLDANGQGLQLMASEDSISESENDDVFKASKKQKMFAKMSIKREKQKEKEHKRNVEKNMISMDDYLKKQSEFKMWLYEEKLKTASDLSSPKMKTLFKQFVRLWNRRKLAVKYYRCSDLPESPAPLTPLSCNFLAEDKAGKALVLDPPAEAVAVKEPPKSPFVTFGKTPPKVLRSKKLQLFPTSHDVCLISVAPIGSPLLARPDGRNNSEDKTTKGTSKYHVPFTGKSEEKEEVSADEGDRGPVPYKVSIYPWAAPDDASTNTSMEVCSTATPPGRNKSSDDTSWPLPPSEEELASMHGKRINDSPQLPPPPPPRSESLLSNSGVSSPAPLDDNYADPYDKLPEKRQGSSRLVSHYQEPLDCMRVVNTRTIPENPGLVLKTFSTHNDEPDLSMYQKPIQEKRLSKEELEELYAKPMKKQKKSESQKHETKMSSSDQKGSGLYAEIMDHLNKTNENKSDANKGYKKIDPDYETIDECLAKMDRNSEMKEMSPEKKVSKPVVRQKPVGIKKPTNELSGFAGRKTTVLAASSDKIYETYLSLGRNVNPFKMSAADPLKQGELLSKSKSRSQPDISFGDGLQVYDTINIQVGNSTPECTKPQPILSSFKPIDTKFGHSVDFQKQGFNKYKLLSASQRAKSCEDGLKDLEMPGTPTIMATPSFDSLCAVTPLSRKSGSSLSLPANCNSSSDSFLHDSSLSSTASSSLSCATGDHSGSLQSLHSDKSLSPVQEEDESTPKVDAPVKDSNYITPEQVKAVDGRSEFTPQPDPFQVTPGKVSAGIDLSVYLLKPSRQQDSASQQSLCTREDHRTEMTEAHSKGQHDNQIRSKLFENQSKLVIKDTLSGVKTMVDQPKVSTRKDAPRRHTVQTVREIKTTPGPKTGVLPLSVPNIGVAVRSKKMETFSGKQLMPKEKTSGEMSDEEISRQYGSGTRVVGEAGEQYLETDLDLVLEERSKQQLKKSKSHSGFESSSSTVVTEIW